MEIKTVSIIGLGALGVLFGHQLSKSMPEGTLRMVADQARIDRYEKESLFCNGEKCAFTYVTPEEKGFPADLLIFAVKYSHLEQAIVAAKNQVGDNTVVLSLLNGITSEEIIGRAYGAEKLLYAVAQGMDAVKEGNRLTYHQRGMICFGSVTGGASPEKAEQVANFFRASGVPFEIDNNMKKRLWGKFMLNVGVNQTVAVWEGNYGTIQREGAPRDTMIAAMREVLTLSESEGIYLGEEDLAYWLRILGTLNPEGKPSMRQDMEAGRFSEVELFSGTVLNLGKKHKLSTPVNQKLYEKIKEVESRYA